MPGAQRFDDVDVVAASAVERLGNSVSVEANAIDLLLEQNDEWLLQCRYMQIEGMAELTPRLLDTELDKLPPLAA